VRALLRVARHEARTILADRGALMILVLGALGYAFFYPIPYLNQVVRSVPVVVVDPDGTALSRRLTRMVDATEAVRVDAVVTTPAEAERRVRRGEAHGVLSIPAGFERDVLRGEPVVVGAFGDASYFLLYSQVASTLARSVGTLSAGVEVRRMEATGVPRSTALQRWRPLPLVLRPLYNPVGGYGTYVVPAVLVIVLQQTLLIGIGLLAGTARERGVNEGRLLGASRLELVLGKAGVYVALYLGHALLYLTMVYRVFGFPRQAHPVVALLFLVPFLLAVTFLGLAVSAWFRERESAIQVLLFTSLPAVFISGFSWPPEAMPRWVRGLALLLPSTTSISGFLRLNQMGAGFAQVRGAWLTLWALAAVYLVLALLALRAGDGSSRTPAP
jgi:ABC-2 type transport system permease protein